MTKKIKKILGFAFRDDIYHIRVLWADRVVSWETPQSVNCPLLLENFMNKIECKIYEQIEKEEENKKKLDEKSFIESLRKKPEKIDSKLLKNFTKKPNTKIFIKQYETDTEKNLNGIQFKNKNFNEPYKLEKQTLDHLRPQKNLNLNQKAYKSDFQSKNLNEKEYKLDLNAYKPDFKSNNHFLSNRRYFETRTQDSVKESEPSKIEIKSYKETPDYIMYEDGKECASLKIKEIINVSKCTEKVFNVAYCISKFEFEILLFTLRQSNFGNIDILSVQFLPTKGNFIDKMKSLNEIVLVDRTSILTFFVGPKILEKFGIYNDYTIIRLPKESLMSFNTLMNFHNFNFKDVKHNLSVENNEYGILQESLELNTWNLKDIDYYDHVMGHIAFHQIDLQNIKKYCIFSMFKSQNILDLDDYLQRKNKLRVDFDNTELDTIFVENIDVINNMPCFNYLLETKCQFYRVDSSRIESIFKNGSVIILSNNFFESENIDFFMNFMKENKKEHIVYSNSFLASKCEDIIQSDPSKSYYRDFLRICRKVQKNVANELKILKNIRNLYFEKQRFFYVIDAHKDYGLYRTPSKFLSIVKNFNL